ncbi:hypothetical protein [Hymenobacter glaciei]
MDTLPLRTQFGLTQEMMAEWLGVARSSLALTERGYQSTTAGTGEQTLRLQLAAQGLVYDGAGGSFSAPAAPPEPLPDAGELGYRLRQCRAQAQGIALKLEVLRRRTAPHEARWAAAPALRAYPGPVADPEQEANWLTVFELEAKHQLRKAATERQLLEARLAGLEREAELLANMLAPPPIP